MASDFTLHGNLCPALNVEFKYFIIFFHHFGSIDTLRIIFVDIEELCRTFYSLVYMNKCHHNVLID